jgi:toxin YhaV
MQLAHARAVSKRSHALVVMWAMLLILAALNKLVFGKIPADPAAIIYRQGSSLGDDYKHRFRAKFGNGGFHLFFRCDSNAKVIIFAWVNDETTLRTSGAKTGAHKVFKGMVDDGNPPDHWAALRKACSEAGALEQLDVFSSEKP